MAVRAPVRAPGHGAGWRSRCRCVAERATALKGRVFDSRAWHVNRCIYGPRHTLLLERIPAISAPTVQTAKRFHVWLFGRLEPLVETLLPQETWDAGIWDRLNFDSLTQRHVALTRSCRGHSQCSLEK